MLKVNLILGGRFAFEKDYNKGKLCLYSVTTIKGKIVHHNLSNLIDYTRPEEKWYQIPKQTGKIYWQEPFIDRETNLICTRVSAPIIKNGKFLGVSSIQIDLTKFKSFVDTVFYSSSQFHNRIKERTVYLSSEQETDFKRQHSQHCRHIGQCRRYESRRTGNGFR